MSSGSSGTHSLRRRRERRVPAAGEGGGPGAHPRCGFRSRAPPRSAAGPQSDSDQGELRSGLCLLLRGGCACQRLPGRCRGGWQDGERWGPRTWPLMAFGLRWTAPLPAPTRQFCCSSLLGATGGPALPAAFLTVAMACVFGERAALIAGLWYSDRREDAATGARSRLSRLGQTRVSCGLVRAPCRPARQPQAPSSLAQTASHPCGDGTCGSLHGCLGVRQAWPHSVGAGAAFPPARPRGAAKGVSRGEQKQRQQRSKWSRKGQQNELG